MKYIILILLLISCGKNNSTSDSNYLPISDECTIDNQFRGYWYSQDRNDVLLITSDCRYQQDYCSSVGRIEPQKNNEGVYNLQVLTTDRTIEECKDIGLYTCALKIEGQFLITNCGGLKGITTYQR